MSKKNQNNVEDSSLHTANSSQETVETLPDEMQAASPAETPPNSGQGKPNNTDYVCPACKNTTCVVLGLPYHKGEQECQYVKCGKCDNVSVQLL